MADPTSTEVSAVTEAEKLSAVRNALATMPEATNFHGFSLFGRPWWFRLGASALAIYHGFSRSQGNLPTALVYGAAGGIFPVTTTTVALAQGIAKPVGRL